MRFVRVEQKGEERCMGFVCLSTSPKYKNDMIQAQAEFFVLFCFYLFFFSSEPI